MKSRISRPVSAESTTASVEKGQPPSGNKCSRFWCCSGDDGGDHDSTHSAFTARRRTKFPIPSLSSLFQHHNNPLSPLSSATEAAESDVEKETNTGYLPQCDMRYTISNSNGLPEDEGEATTTKPQSPRFLSDIHFTSDFTSDFGDDSDVGDFIEEVHSVEPVTPATTLEAPAASFLNLRSMPTIDSDDFDDFECAETKEERHGLELDDGLIADDDSIEHHLHRHDPMDPDHDDHDDLGDHGDRGGHELGTRRPTEHSVDDDHEHRISESLRALELEYGDILRLLRRIDPVATSSLMGHLKMKNDDDSDGGLSPPDNEQKMGPQHATISVMDAARDTLRALSPEASRSVIAKWCFVSLHQNERVFVKMALSPEHRAKMTRSIGRYSVLRSYWDSATQHDDLRTDAPFLPLRGWWRSDGDDATMATVYPLALKLSEYIRSAVITDSDFGEFENGGDSDSATATAESGLPPPAIDWSLNLQQMASIRDGLFRIAEFVANLHCDGVSHRNICVDNVFVSRSDPTTFYISKYAQSPPSSATQQSPEAEQFGAGRLPSYSPSKSDVWSFGCVLVQIFGVGADECIRRLSAPGALEDAEAVRLILARHLGVDHRSQTKKIAVLRLLSEVFTAESRRPSLSAVCGHEFFASPWSHI